MGFFSAKCTICGHSLLSLYSVNDINAWMQHAVLIDKDGNIHTGVYDGYGRLESDNGEYEADNLLAHTVYHRACWEKAGKPTAYAGPSKNAPDQGYFFNTEHDVPDPRTS